ncbi:MAG: hypothetical protein KBD46_02590 [Candidatus Levybacteria bacterium]|nr:hypothetical protein [Candidatus Levybacteria bacterium]
MTNRTDTTNKNEEHAGHFFDFLEGLILLSEAKQKEMMWHTNLRENHEFYVTIEIWNGC